MSSRKKITKKTLKIFVPIADRLFSNKKIKNVSLRAISKIQQRYAKYGEEVEITLPRKYQGSWEFMLDTPKIAKSANRKVYVSGWLVPLGNEQKVLMRIQTPANVTKKLVYGIDRSDVAAILRTRHRKKISDKCGFGSTISIDEDGTYIIEVKIGNSAWQKVCRIELEYDLDLLARDVFNPALAQNMAEHLTLIGTKKRYFYEKEIQDAYMFDEATDPKLIAFYLPQFHPFKENDIAWGKGFTEWSNVASATPRFVGHEQPKLPTDLGYYDLRYEDNILKQIELAKNHGLYGFCFYYYWFSGKRLLERPLNSFLSHQEWDFNFMICWANENWTRRWDGRAEDVIIEQKHKPDDPLRFIEDVAHILLDKRYIRVDDKPVLVVYRAHDLDNTSEYVRVWREYFREKYGQELHLVAVKAFSNDNPTEYGFDKALDFVPLSIATTLQKPIPSYNISEMTLDLKYTGIAYDYREVALELSNPKYVGGPAYNTIMPSWDNDARKKGSGGVFHNSNPDLYGHWLDSLINRTSQKPSNLNNNLIFVNAWNEWAEGTYLEPDTMYGHGFLNRTAQVLSKYSINEINRNIFPMYGIRRQNDTKLAVIVHLFYADLWELFEQRLSALDGVKYDLFVTIPAKNEFIKQKITKFSPRAEIIITPNRGRDVLPFVHLARRLKEVGYEYILKIHSKKSTHRADGNTWMEDMLRKLIPTDKDDVNNLLKILEKPNTGIIGPAGHYVSLNTYFGSNKNKMIAALDTIIGHAATDKIVKNVEKHGFFAGTMFWARLDAIDLILNQFYQPSDFESESGQIDGTFAHAIERILSIVPYLNNKKLYMIDSGQIKEISRVLAENFEDYSFAKNED